jgi:hypothetical protein
MPPGFADTWRTWELVLPALERHHHVLALTLAGDAGRPPIEGEIRDGVLADPRRVATGTPKGADGVANPNPWPSSSGNRAQPSARAAGGRSGVDGKRRFDAVGAPFDAADDAPVRLKPSIQARSASRCVVMTHPWRPSERSKTQYSSQICVHGCAFPLCVVNRGSAFCMSAPGTPKGAGRGRDRALQGPPGVARLEPAVGAAEGALLRHWCALVVARKGLVRPIPGWRTDSPLWAHG